MDAPPPLEDVRPFLVIARHLISMGYSAPQIFAEDIVNGLLIIEDFGDQTYTHILAQNQNLEYILYGLAVDLLIDLHRRSTRETLSVSLPSYDHELLNEEALLFPDWYLPAVTGKPTSAVVRKSYVKAWSTSLAYAAAQPPTLVLRDFHVDNLIWLTSKDGVKACGLLDFQDAVAGPAAYDLMSLLEDARRDVSEELFTSMVDRYFSAFSHLERENFETVFSILAAQRHAKIIGIFTRLNLRDAKPAYSAHIPRVWKLLEESLKHPSLSTVAKWFEDYVPPNLRITPKNIVRVP